MGSLYRRALDIYNHRPQLRLLRPEEKTVAEPEPLDIEGPAAQEQGGSEQEEQILAELDRTVSESRMKIDEETFAFEPTRKTVLLPLAVNVGALLLVAAAVFVLMYFFDRDQTQAVTARSEITSAEGRLLEAVRSESEAALSAKDREIANIRDQLVSINQEWETAQAEAEARLAAEETRLRAELEAQLQAERGRLTQEGVSEAQIDAAIAELQAQREAEIVARLSQIRSELEAELEEQEQSYLALQSEFESTLEAAQAEREAIEEQAAERIAQLNAELAQREGRLEAERQEAATQLDELRSRREREELVLDQLIARYGAINESVSNEDYDAALEGLSELRGYLQDPSVSQLPAIQRRLSTETFIISTIEEVVRERRGLASTPTLADAARMELVADRVEEANALYEAGDVDGASRIYREAVAEIPAVATALQRLEEAQELAETERLAAAEEAAEAGSALLASEEYERSLEQFRSALAILAADSETEAQELSDGILAAGAQLLRAENQQLREELDAARLALTERPPEPEAAPEVQEPAVPERGPSLLLQRLEAIEERLVASSRSPSGPREDLASLLQAKVVTRRILNSEPTRSQYPGLGSELDRYFDALAAEGESQGRRATLVDLASVLTEESPEGLGELSEEALWRRVFSSIERLATSYPEETEGPESSQ